MIAKQYEADKAKFHKIRLLLVGWFYILIQLIYLFVLRLVKIARLRSCRGKSTRSRLAPN